MYAKQLGHKRIRGWGKVVMEGSNEFVDRTPLKSTEASQEAKVEIEVVPLSSGSIASCY